MRFVARALLLAGTTITLAAGSPPTFPAINGGDEKLDAEFQKVLTELAKQFDEAKDPEASHFFASCALGFGGKDEKLNSIKGGWEIAVYIGKQRGGKVLEDVNPIDVALRGVASKYKKTIDALLPAARKKEISEADKKTLLEAGPKYEIARGAQDYIRAAQRINALRQAAGLRPVLWGFEMSKKCILAAWYMAETVDYDDSQPFSKNSADKNSVFYTDFVEEAKKACAISPQSDLKDYPERLRPTALMRQDLLNPNARVLCLARWSRGKMAALMTLYAIPHLPYREDIPTPSARFKNETVVQPWPDWKDTEETVSIGGKRVPLVRYPYGGEVDTHWRLFASESSWSKADDAFVSKAGLPIMLRLFAETEFTEIETTLVDASGSVIPCRLYKNGDGRLPLEPWATILLVPERFLGKGAKHTVSIKCKVDGVALEKTWTFSTRRE